MAASAEKAWRAAMAPSIGRPKTLLKVVSTLRHSKHRNPATGVVVASLYSISSSVVVCLAQRISSTSQGFRPFALVLSVWPWNRFYAAVKISREATSTFRRGICDPINVSRPFNFFLLGFSSKKRSPTWRLLPKTALLLRSTRRRLLQPETTKSSPSSTTLRISTSNTL